VDEPAGARSSQGFARRPLGSLVLKEPSQGVSVIGRMKNGDPKGNLCHSQSEKWGSKGESEEFFGFLWFVLFWSPGSSSSHVRTAHKGPGKAKEGQKISGRQEEPGAARRTRP
jgi:hypothetical protein